jgi:hypothetical protein
VRGVRLPGTLRDRWRAPESVYLSMGALLGEPGGGAALLENLKDM